MDDEEWLAGHFERHRPQLRSIAYRMLGSLAEADDAVQDAWLRLSRSGADDVENLSGWLTTIVARVCLNILRSRGRRREEPFDVHVPDPVITLEGEAQPEDAALLTDSVGLAMLVVLDTLTPDERVAFVLHDMFGLPFKEIGLMLGRSPAAAKQLASRARHRVGGDGPAPDRDPARQREVVDAFYAAARRGDFAALIGVLHPDVVARSDGGVGWPAASTVTRGAEAVVRQAILVGTFQERHVHPVLVNGSAGAVVTVRGKPFSVMSFTVADGKVTEINTIVDRERVGRIAAAVLAG
jgi:RNA polymerase sigma-70 factor (ECF subfamily)